MRLMQYCEENRRDTSEMTDEELRHITKAFEACDVNKNGSIDPEELTAMMGVLGADVTLLQVQQVMQKNRAEYDQWCAREQETGSNPNLRLSQGSYLMSEVGRSASKDQGSPGSQADREAVVQRGTRAKTKLSSIQADWLKHGGQCVVLPSHRPILTCAQVDHELGNSIRTSLIVTFSIPLSPPATSPVIPPQMFFRGGVWFRRCSSAVKVMLSITRLLSCGRVASEQKPLALLTQSPPMLTLTSW